MFSFRENVLWLLTIRLYCYKTSPTQTTLQCTRDIPTLARFTTFTPPATYFTEVTFCVTSLWRSLQGSRPSPFFAMTRYMANKSLFRKQGITTCTSLCSSLITGDLFHIQKITSIYNSTARKKKHSTLSRRIKMSKRNLKLAPFQC